MAAPELRVGCVQLNAGADPAGNAERVTPLVARAVRDGAELVVLPEMWNALGDDDVLRAAAEPREGGLAVDAMRGWAREHGITLVGGSIMESRPGRERLSNLCLVFAPDGEVVAEYRKLHMFDVDVGGQSYRESDSKEPGDEIVGAELCGWQVGLSICFDVRFPELYRALALGGAELITVPAAFTLHTGRDHWELLLRARAVENGCYLAAADQWGVDVRGRSLFGRSMIVDPWGTVIAQAADEDCAIVATVERSRLEAVRASIPALRQRRPDVYGSPAPAVSAARPGARPAVPA
ncbi:MAG: carbon-nitrogen hydrolase family protein [Actinobacteria bacterium]|nr:carbon-nitrogen hydrolase family protein [Actinomycetota bacterium]